MTYLQKEISFQTGQPPDRRGGSRTKSIYRPALIETDGFAGFCLIRNLSSGGLMGKVYAHFSPNRSIRVMFNSQIAVTGTIVWSKESQIGVQFDNEIDMEQLLHDLGNSHIGNKVNRAPRLEVECAGEIETKTQRLPMTLQDISQRGIKAKVSSVWPGDEVVVRLDGIEARKATVRWVQNGSAGLNFLTPLGFEELAEWVIRRQQARIP